VLNKEAEEKHIRIVGLNPTTQEPKSSTLMQNTEDVQPQTNAKGLINGKKSGVTAATTGAGAGDELAAFLGMPKSENSVTNTDRQESVSGLRSNSVKTTLNKNQSKVSF